MRAVSLFPKSIDSGATEQVAETGHANKELKHRHCLNARVVVLSNFEAKHEAQFRDW